MSGAWIPEALPARHAAFLEKCCTILAADVRIHAVLGGGSLIHGGMDEFSDLDFIVVVDGKFHGEILASRLEIAHGLGQLLGAFTGEHVGEPRLLICLYGPELLHVDLKFVALADLDRLVERPVILWSRDKMDMAERLDCASIAWPERDAEWFEARAWIWLHYGAAKALRGELFEAIGMLAFFREQVLGPMLHRRAGRPQRGVRRLESWGLDEAEGLRATLASHDSKAVRSALIAAAELYLVLRIDDPPHRPFKDMPHAFFDFLGHEPNVATHL